ncbi:MAG TPA: protein kinase [Haliangiales bacterium]|nr:protein kinase [Haliangiales bacterium]
MRFCPVCHGRYEDVSRFCPRDGIPLPSDEDDPLIGTVLFGQFELLEVAGEGAMGTVYRAWQTGMERQVAVKILRPELMRDPAVVKRFDREARAVARLTHPNIVTVFMVGQTEDGLPFIVMEFVEGEALADVLRREGKFPTMRVLRIARQVTSALAEAHAEGIVHRDLKPANILITHRRRAQDFVKVLDFGIAKIVREGNPQDPDAESRLTKQGTIFGTPHYIAPEQAQGGDIDHRADIYSLGVVMYRLVTGRLPFDGGGISVLLAHMQQKPPAPRDLAPDLDAGVEAVIMKAMEKDPANRYQTAEEMSEAIEAAAVAMGGTPVAWPSFSGRIPVARTTDEENTPPPPLAPGSSPRSSSSFEMMSPGADNPEASLLHGEASELRPPSSRRGFFMVVAGALLVGIGLGGAYVAGWFGPAKTVAMGAGTQGPTTPTLTQTPTPTPTPTRAAAPDAGVPAGYRALALTDSGYGVRAQVPESPSVGESYQIELDVADPDGRPVSGENVLATIDEPTGDRRPLPAPAEAGKGRYVLRRTFLVPGKYTIHVLPIASKPDVHMWFDFEVGGDDVTANVPEPRGTPKKAQPPKRPRPRPRPNPDGLE